MKKPDRGVPPESLQMRLALAGVERLHVVVEFRIPTVDLLQPGFALLDAFLDLLSRLARRFFRGRFSGAPELFATQILENLGQSVRKSRLRCRITAPGQQRLHELGQVRARHRTRETTASRPAQGARHTARRARHGAGATRPARRRPPCEASRCRDRAPLARYTCDCAFFAAARKSSTTG